MDKEMMEIMVADWMADNADEMSDLTLDGAPYYDSELGCWCQLARDGEHTYTLTEHDGNIAINY